MVIHNTLPATFLSRFLKIAIRQQSRYIKVSES